MNGSLFDRLTNTENLIIDEDESIRRHLLRLLTARAGSVQALPDYGLPDLNNLLLSKAELLRAICLAIQTCISKYEPRLIDSKVSALPSSDTSINLVFNIQAQKLNTDGSSAPWRWNIMLNGQNVQESS